MKLRENLRIITAMAAKDILDALKNKNTLVNIVMVFLLVIFYRWLPILTKDLISDASLLIYDPGGSRLVSTLEASPEFYPFQMESMERFRALIDHIDVRELGLVVPADFDEVLDSGGQPVLSGYITWPNRFKAEELRADFERQISAALGQPVSITIEEVIISSHDSMGDVRTVALSFLITLFFLANLTVPHLMYEEKQARTIDALRVSPASVSQMVVGKALAGLFYCLAGAIAVHVAFSTYMVNWGLALLTSATCILLSVGLGLALGTFLDNRQQLMVWFWIITMPLLVPTFLMGVEPILPEAVRTVFPWIPTVSLVVLFRYALSTGAPLAQVVRLLAIALASGVLLLALVVWRVRQMDR